MGELLKRKLRRRLQKRNFVKELQYLKPRRRILGQY